MTPHEISSEMQRIDRLVAVLEKTSQEVDPVIQNVFSNHIVLAGAGLIEKSIEAILYEYSGRRGSPPLRKYVKTTVGYNNSLNCEKIERILNSFEKDWWKNIKNTTTEQERAAVDSLKTLRDQVAHGKPNGTGFVTVRDYYKLAKSFVAKICMEIIP